MRQQPPNDNSLGDETPGSQQTPAPHSRSPQGWSHAPGTLPTQPYQAPMQQPTQWTRGSPQLPSGTNGSTARSRKRRLGVLLLILSAMLVLSAGILAALSLIQQNARTSPWVHLPPGAKPTVPANGYLFKDPTGGYVVYTFPATPPAQITWQIYRNAQNGYRIDIPSQWVRVQADSAGHAGLLFYPTGTVPGENVPGGPDGVGFRWTNQYRPPAPNDQTIADARPITVSGVAGRLYTQGSLGNTIVAAIPYRQETFVLTASADTDVLIYVFQHMLQSLTFT